MNTITQLNPSNNKAESLYPFCYFFLHYQDFSKEVLNTRNEILLFDYLLYTSQHFMTELKKTYYYHSFATIEKRTGISESTSRRIVKRFKEELKILNTWQGGEEDKWATCYTLDYKRIFVLAPNIYKNVDLKTGDEFFIRRTKNAIREMKARLSRRHKYFWKMYKLQNALLNEENE